MLIQTLLQQEHVGFKQLSLLRNFWRDMNHSSQNKIEDYRDCFYGTRISPISIFAFIYYMCFSVWFVSGVTRIHSGHFLLSLLLYHTISFPCTEHSPLGRGGGGAETNQKILNTKKSGRQFSFCLILSETNAFLCCLTSIPDKEKCGVGFGGFLGGGFLLLLLLFWFFFFCLELVCSLFFKLTFPFLLHSLDWSPLLYYKCNKTVKQIKSHSLFLSQLWNWDALTLKRTELPWFRCKSINDKTI